MMPSLDAAILRRRTALHVHGPAAALVAASVLVAALLVCASAGSGRMLARAEAEKQDRAEQYRDKFERQTDAVHRAKLMRKLGTAEFQTIEDEMAAGQINQALAGLQQYRDQAQTAEKGLDARGINAESHPSGFKELQFSLRDSLLHLDRMIAGIPASQQGPFLSIRKDLDSLNRHVIRELFPRQPAAGEPSAKTARGKS